MEKLLAVIAMLANAGKDTIFKVAAEDEGGSKTTLFYGIKAAIIALLSLVILLVQGKPLLHLPTLPWAIPLGVLAMTTYTLALKSLAGGDASTSVTVFRLNFVLSSGAAALFLGEAFTSTKLAGLGLSLAA
ncbi:MAG: EamA family transporter, partial [Rectinemataceae bacterium]